MGYKLLGFVVWQGGKLYLRRHVSGTRQKLFIAGLAALVVGGVVAAQRGRAPRADRRPPGE